VIEKPGAVAGQQPMRVNSGERDEAEDRLSRNGAAALIAVQGSERDLEGSGQQRSSVFTVKCDSDVADSARNVSLERPPVRVIKRFFHRNATNFKKRIGLRFPLR